MALPEEKRDLVKALTSNLSVEAENLFVELRFPFSELEKCTENTISSPERDDAIDPKSSETDEIIWDEALQKIYVHCVETHAVER
jgi:hypothetical protein